MGSLLVLFIVGLVIYLIRKNNKALRNMPGQPPERIRALPDRRTRRFPLPLIILAAIVAPLALAFFSSLFTGTNMWNENGPGAYLWLYIIIIPAAAIIILLRFIDSIRKK